MAKAKARPYPPSLLELMASKTAILLKARTFADMGMAETAQPMWAVAASYEERIAPLLDILGQTLEAAASRISAASCSQKGGDSQNRPNPEMTQYPWRAHERTSCYEERATSPAGSRAGYLFARYIARRALKAADSVPSSR